MNPIENNILKYYKLMNKTLNLNTDFHEKNRTFYLFNLIIIVFKKIKKKWDSENAARLCYFSTFPKRCSLIASKSWNVTFVQIFWYCGWWFCVLQSWFYTRLNQSFFSNRLRLTETFVSNMYILCVEIRDWNRTKTII